MKCPDCAFTDETPMIDKFMKDGPFVLRDIWYQHFGSHVGFADMAPQKKALQILRDDSPFIASLITPLINEMT